jgi:thioredoxin reductase (NADPH)
MRMQHWDVVVVGGGPAGLASAAVVGEAGLSCLCLDRLGPGGMLMNLGPIHHAPGLPPDTTGPDLLAQMVDRAMAGGAELTVAEVLRLEGGGPWTLETDDGAHRASAVILATGLTAGLLGVDGEATLEGRGLSHCAACDGPLYAGRSVVVAGADEWALQETADLAAVAAHVTLVRGDPARPDVGVLAGLDNVDVIDGRIVALEGDGEGLQAVTIQAGDARRRLDAAAVFVYTGRTPVVSFARTLLDLDGSGHIMVDDSLRTRASSLFAAGDVRTSSSQRVVDAIADGERAGRAAVDVLRAAVGSKT